VRCIFFLNQAVFQPPVPKSPHPRIHDVVEVWAYSWKHIIEHTADPPFWSSGCYEASKTGFVNMSIFVLFAPQDSLRLALTGWSLTIAVTICYIIMLYLADNE
jgi:hypothetical protein